MEYLFTLNYLLPLEGCDPLQLVERLGAAGCTDVLVGTCLLYTSPSPRDS